jgi:hypothetical protein
MQLSNRELDSDRKSTSLISGGGAGFCECSRIGPVLANVLGLALVRHLQPFTGQQSSSQ